MDIQHKKKKFWSKRNTEFRHPSVYLMKDNISNFIKIGKSIQPLKREKTLQSEKPTITMFLICPCGNEKNANEVEKYLHELFNSKRVRGEWFDLNENDINIITSKYQWMNTEDFKKYCEDNNESNTDAHKEEFVLAVKHGLIAYEETMTLCNNMLEKIKNGTLKLDEVSDINNFLKHYV